MAALAWGPVGDGVGFAEWVRQLRGRSGVYLIRHRGGELLYVGESHSGRLYETLTRHFQSWGGPTAGYVYDRARVEVSVIVTPPADAVELQFEMIAEHSPRDNNVGQAPDLDEVPF